jgi:hypothetical protein
MSGRAIIVVVTGIIIISSVIFYNIEAASTRITANFNEYYLRQSAQNIAQSGANLALRQLGNDRTWRTGFSNLSISSGKADVVLFDTVFLGISSVAIRSTGTAEYGTQAISTVYAYFPPGTMPIGLKGLLTLNSDNQVNGNIDVDARDHDLNGNLISGQGTFAIWTTGNSFTFGGSSRAGGTAGGTDYGLSNPPHGNIIKTNRPQSEFPATPDSVFGGASSGYPEGTLKAIAQSGVAGSQYVTDPSKLKFPLSGVTYVETPSTSPQNIWNPPGKVTGSGILIVHNSTKNAAISNMDGDFEGIMVADDISHLHGNFLGAIVGLTKTPTGNVIGNGNARIQYSKAAILSAQSLNINGTVPNVIAWWE